MVARAPRRSTPSSRLLSHHLFPIGKSPGFLLFLKPLLVPLKHRRGLLQSYSRTGLSDSALGAEAKELLTEPEKGAIQDRGQRGSQIPPTSLRPSELEPDPWYRPRESEPRARRVFAECPGDSEAMRWLTGCCFVPCVRAGSKALALPFTSSFGFAGAYLKPPLSF